MHSRSATKSTLNEYFHYKSLFVQGFQKQIHRELLLERIFRPGLMGQALLDTLPMVLFKSEYMHNPGTRRQAHIFFPELYRVYINKKSKLHIDQTDEHILVALVLYALWTYRTAWIFSLADLLREGRINTQNGDAVLKVACVLALLQGERKRANMIFSLIKKPDPFFEMWTSSLATKKNTSIATENQNKQNKLLLYNYILNKNQLEEKKLIFRITREKPASVEDLLDYYSVLMHRGLVFLALRYLQRYKQSFAQAIYLESEYLHQFLLNGKHLAYLRILARMDRLVNWHNWYEARFCVSMLDMDENSPALLDQVMFNKENHLPQSDENRVFRFEQAIAAAKGGIQFQAFSEPWLNDLIAVIRLNHTTGPLRVKESFSSFEKIVAKSNKNKDGWDCEKMAIYFPYLNDKFLLYADKPAVQNIWLLLQSLASRNCVVRIHFGFMAHNKGFNRIAKTYLDTQVVHLDEQLHQLAEMAIFDQNYAQALVFYKRLVARSPNHEICHYNLGLIYERLDDRKAALKEFARALEINPGYLPARDRLEILQH